VRWAALGLTLALAACAQPPILPKSPIPGGPAIRIKAEAVPLDPTKPNEESAHLPTLGECVITSDRPFDPTEASRGFTYAGGIALTSDDTSRLHGLSDLKVKLDGSLLAESDEGDLLKARLVFDSGCHLVGITDARMTVLQGVDGKPLQNKKEADAEGVALLANGDMLVSFEEHDRILVYPAKGGPPREAPSPDVKFPFNLGMEALAAYPKAGPNAYVVGGEASGQTWICKLSGGCIADRLVAKLAEYGLVAVAPLDDGRIAYLLRAWDPIRGSRITLVLLDAKGAELGRLDLAKPLTVDNFEGLAAVTGGYDGIRFYLISDDNFSPSQHTLLLAFDWKTPFQ
jgi:hypothetical protein